MKQTVYDKEGASYELDSVDAREYLATGRYFNDAPEAGEDKPKRTNKTSKKTALDSSE